MTIPVLPFPVIPEGYFGVFHKKRQQGKVVAKAKTVKASNG
jgi:hypothetical protein